MWIDTGCAHGQHRASRRGPAQRRVDLNEGLRSGTVNTDFLNHAYDLVPNGTVIPYVLTHRAFVRPETPRQIFIDDDDCLAFAVFLASEGRGRQSGHPHGAVTVTAD